MSKIHPVLVCAANISHGKKDDTLEAIIHAINNIAGQKLIHVDNNLSANRSVLTFAGYAPYVAEAAFQAIKTASERIDMRRHTGVHPRMGAVDVCPLIPLGQTSMKQATRCAETLAERVGRKLHIPVYCYEYNAKKSYRKQLPAIRKGEYEGLPFKMQQSRWHPDYGPGWDSSFKAQILRTGATVIGARKVLIAYNVSLNSRSADLAKSMARQLRSSGYRENGKPKKGKFAALRAIGWYVEDFGTAQVSMNFTDYKQTSPLEVWEAIRQLAGAAGVTVAGSELVGLIPEACILEAGFFSTGSSEAQIRQPLPAEEIKRYLSAGIDYLGLNRIKPFDPEEQVLEYAVRNAGFL